MVDPEKPEARLDRTSRFYKTAAWVAPLAAGAIIGVDTIAVVGVGVGILNYALHKRDQTLARILRELHQQTLDNRGNL